MENDKDIIEAIADRLNDELDVEEQRLPAEIVEKLFALEFSETRNKPR